jgi:hypothetical protein
LRLHSEYEIMGRVGQSHEHAADMVAYELAVRKDLSLGIAEQNRLIEQYKGQLDGLAVIEKVDASLQDLSATLADVTMDFKNAAQYAEQFARSLAHQALQEFYYQSIGAPIKSWVAGMFQPGNGNASMGATDISRVNAGVATVHGGGVGREAGPSKWVPLSILAGAARAHSGLGPNEVPRIVTRDEGIFTRGQMKALGLGLRSARQAPNINIDFHNNGTPMDATVDEPQWDADLEQYVIGVVLNNVSAGGELRNVIRNPQ